MTNNFLIQAPWPAFAHGDKTFDLSHLHERVDYAIDSSGTKRVVLITYADHCFTREAMEGEDAAPPYPGCSRASGRFCFERYELSLELNDHLDFSRLKEVWNTKNDEHYAIVRGVTHQGAKTEYAVIFSLEKLKGVQAPGGVKIDLHMRIRTAHKRERERTVETFGSVRFAHLVTLAMKNERP
jgi:hypothetical protein